LPQLEVQKVDDFPEPHAVAQVAECSPEDQAERQRGQAIPRGQLEKEREDDTDGDTGDGDEEDEPDRLGQIRQHTERRAAIVHASEVEKPLDHRDLIAKDQLRLDQKFRDLIEYEAHGGNQGENA
jgi:hypothetical protein